MHLFKKISLIVLGLLTALTVLLAGVIFFKGDYIKAQLVSAINDQIDTEIYVKKGIHIEFWSHFPNITVSFNEIEIKEKAPLGDRNFLKAEKVEFVINIWDIFRTDYIVRRVILENGKFTFEQFSDGSLNYDILKKQETEQETAGDFNLDIRKIELNNIEIDYKDNINNFFISTAFEKSTVSARMDQKEFTAFIDAACLVNLFEIDEHSWITSENFSFKGEILINTELRKYLLNDINIQFAGIDFKTSGEISAPTDSWFFDMNISAEAEKLDDLQSYLPEYVRNNFDGINGHLSLESVIKGELSSDKIPEITADFRVKDAAFKSTLYRQNIEKITANGKFTSGTAIDCSSCELNVNDISFQWENQRLSGGVQVKNLKKPVIQANANGLLSLEVINHFADLPYQTKGNLTIRDFKITVHPEFLATNIDRAIPQLSGGLDFQNLTFQNGNEKLTAGTVQLALNNRQIEIKKMVLKDAYQDLEIKGNTNNLISYFAAFNPESKIAANPTFNLNISGKKLDIEKIADFFNASPGSQSENQDVVEFDLYDFLNFSGSITANLNQIKYGTINTSDFKGDLRMTSRQARLNNFSFNAARGRFTGNAVLNVRKNNNVDIEGSFQARNVNIQQLFNKCYNFGQDFITGKHISGLLDTDVTIGNYWRNGEYDLDRLTVIADLNLKNGRLINFEPMEALSSYIHTEELKNIQFSNLSNHIEIGNSRVFIPGMNINTNAFKIHLEGIHTFENEIDYNVRVNLSHILANRYKSRRVSRDYWEDTSEGITLFLSMKGMADKPDISYNSRAAREKIAEDFRRQGGEVRNAFRGELEDYDRRRENRDWETEAEPEFIDWD